VLLVSCNFGVWIVSARSTPYNRELERFGKDRIGLKGLEIWPRLEDKKTDDAHRRRKETAYPLTNLWRTAPHVMRNMVTLAAADLSSLELNFASAGVGDVIEVSAGITLTSTMCVILQRLRKRVLLRICCVREDHIITVKTHYSRVHRF